MATSIRGDGLFRAEAALEALLEDPELLDRARARFSQSPPSYRSLSGDTTQPDSPDLRSDEQKALEEREWELRNGHGESIPHYQFRAQYIQELNRLMKADQNGTSRRPRGISIYQHALDTVKSRWIEQGIWRNEWHGTKAGKRWKHEGPEEAEPGSDSEGPPRSPLFNSVSKRPDTKPIQPPKSVDEVERERRECEASRPYYQFMYQVSKEREWIQEETNDAGRRWGWGEPPKVEEVSVSIPPHINSTAYERVKSTWTGRGIWDERWGILPGMSWKHEQPIEERLREELGDDYLSSGQADPPTVNGDEAIEAPQKRFFPLFPVDLHHQNPDPPCVSQGLPETDDDRTGKPGPRPSLFKSAIASVLAQGLLTQDLDVSKQEPPSSIEPHVIQDKTDHPPSAPPLSHGDAASRPNRRSPRRQRGGPSVKQEETSKARRNILGPVSLSKVSKPRVRDLPGHRGQRRAPKVPTEAGPSVPAQDPPTGLSKAVLTPKRRSTRLQDAKVQPAIPTSVADQHGAGSRKTRRTSGGGSKPASLPKPQGVTKGRPRTTRKKVK